jgi:alpha-ketoglutaric semialdehyde dehydrogenase
VDIRQVEVNTLDILQNYICGSWVNSVSGQTSDNISPVDKNEVICRVQASVIEDATKAIESAAWAYERWRATPAPERAALLLKVLRCMMDREEEFVRTITLENGKTLRESRGEFAAAIKEADYQIGQGRRLGGAYLPSDQPDVTCYLTRQPLGVATLITPWNFPLNVACRKMFPALIAGNTCVIKPADFTPMTTWLLARVMDEVSVPPGVVNYITGRGSVIGDTLVTHPAVKAVSFTGSTEVGLGIAEKLASRETKIQLEMGGKNPLVILADADLDRATDAVTLGAFSCSGQWCTSTSRAIVEAPIYDQVLEMLLEKAGRIVVGNGLDDSTRMGPVAGPKQFETIMNYIAIGKQEGARLCTGGNAITAGDFARGYFIEPTIFADVTSEMRIAREEIFGPVLSVMKAADFDDALRIANDTVYGLSSSIYTNDLAKAQRFVDESEVGLCHVNMPTAWKEAQLEFGGIKDSGRGLPEAGETGAEFFTDHKAVYIRR